MRYKNVLLLLLSVNLVLAAFETQSLLKQCTIATKLFEDQEVNDVVTAIVNKRRFRSNGTFAFVHVPKTGGTSVITALHRLLEGGARCVSWNLQRVLERAGVTTDESLPSANVEIARHSAPCSYIHLKSYRPYFPFRGLQLLPALSERVPPVRAVMGHVMHGACIYLQGEKGEGSCTYTTVLREPVERLISHIRWRCWKNQKRKYCDCSSVANFFQQIERGDPQHLFYGSDNLMVRMLSGVGFYAFNKMISCEEADKTLCTFPYTGGITDAHTKRAISNLARHYPVWGHVGDMPSFLLRLSTAYELQDPDHSLTSSTTHQPISPISTSSYKPVFNFMPVNSNPDSNTRSPSAAAVNASVWERMAAHESHDVTLFKWSTCVLAAFKMTAE